MTIESRIFKALYLGTTNLPNMRLLKSLATFTELPGLEDRVLSKCSDAHIFLEKGT